MFGSCLANIFFNPISLYKLQDSFLDSTQDIFKETTELCYYLPEMTINAIHQFYVCNQKINHCITESGKRNPNLEKPPNT
jgi:hypothetical protein